MANDFPPEKVRAIVAEVASLLKEKKETVSVAETVCCGLLSSPYVPRLKSVVNLPQRTRSPMMGRAVF